MAGERGQVTIKVNTSVDDGEVKDLDGLIEDIKNETVNVETAVEDGEVLAADEEIENLNQTVQVGIDVNDSALQTATQNISDGINQSKQGLSEVGGVLSEITQVGAMDEQNRAFLELNLGATEAAKQVQLINDTVASMPGDDATMRSILSTAQAMGENLDPKQMEDLSKVTADYLQGSVSRGKQALESQSDILKYIIDGNTAELEKGSIVSKQIDKLKDKNSVMERSQAMQEALTAEGFTGIATMDTLANTTQSWEGALYNAQTTMAGLWMDGLKGVTNFGIWLDDATGGLSSMAFITATELGPGLLSVGQGAFTALPGIMQFSEKVGGLSGITSLVSTKISGLPGILGTAGSALTGLGLGPIALIIGALVALAVVIFEVGKAFGWWSDVGTMLEAISAGAQRMWSAFMNNEGVIMIIEQIKDAFNNLMSFFGEIGGLIGEALGFDEMGGQFDIVSAAINALGQVGSYVLPLISGYIHYVKEACAALAPIIIWVIQNVIIPYFQRVYSAAASVWPTVQGIISGAISVISGIISGAIGIWNGLQSAWRTLQSTASSVFGAISGIVSGAGGVWSNFKSTVMGAIQPIIDKINSLKDAASGIGDLLGLGGGGIEIPTVSTGTGAGGYGNTTVSQGNTIIFNMYGDIRDEQTLDDTIEAINSRIQFDALANGVTTNDNGAGAV